MEQKNWPHVRKLVGWARYDSAAALQARNALSADLRLFQNLFQPSMKLLTKVRKGARLLRRYDQPPTPCARVCACPEADPKKVAALRRMRAQTDPFARTQRIDQQLKQRARVARRSGPEPRAALPCPRRSPWHGWTCSRRAPRPLQASAQPTVKNPARAQLAQERRAPDQPRAQHGRTRQPEAPEAPVRCLDDATTPASVRYSDGLTGYGLPESAI